jgi:DedD protein
MRSLLDTEEDEEVKASEITLSTASLLGIFFGLVLICGVFFGFGYSMGRGAGPSAQASTLEAGETSVAANQEPSQPPAPEPAAAQPAPQEAQPETQAEAKAEPQAAPALPKETSAPVRQTPPLISKPAAAREIPAPPAYVPPADAPPNPYAKPMVQIAAVARREDADVLVSALRQRGYGVVVRSEPQDKLLHVQVGPFADRMQAAAIKQKLLSDGYNAIIKQ